KYVADLVLDERERECGTLLGVRRGLSYACDLRLKRGARGQPRGALVERREPKRHLGPGSEAAEVDAAIYQEPRWRAFRLHDRLHVIHGQGDTPRTVPVRLLNSCEALRCPPLDRICLGP